MTGPVTDVAIVTHFPEEEVGYETLSDALTHVTSILGRYVAFPSEEHKWAVAAWVISTRTIDAHESTPRLALLSPERGSGKTRCLEVLELLTRSPIHVVNISAAALFRMIQEKPTLLMDEADTYLGPKVAKEHEDLRGLINAGHRRGAKVIRCAIDKGGVTTEEFSAFTPVALAGIGDLPDTIIDRSVVVPMKRRSPDDYVEPFRHRKAEQVCLPVRELMEEKTDEWTDLLRDYEPVMPPGIVDRAADVWEPIIAIGDTAGPPWDERLRLSAETIVRGQRQQDPSLRVQLLSDCRSIFDDKAVDRLTTESLLKALNDLEEAPWGNLRGSPLDARGLARFLRPFEVRPANHRIGDEVRKGYLRADFHDAWQRYLPPESPSQELHGPREEAAAPLELPIDH